jgi:FkbM family methyltransferase
MLKQRLLRFLPRHRKHALVRRVDRMCRRFHEAYENHNYDSRSNGERLVLDALARQPGIQTIVDVGANVGDWSMLAAQAVPGATIHALEVVPETFDRLRANHAARANIVAYPVGLSDAPGEVDVYCAPGNSSLATCVAGASESIHHAAHPAVRGRVTTGDQFCAEHGIDRIDFLKLDVEGYEPNVLRGFTTALTSGRIKVVQFEYGTVNILIRFLLRDFYDLLAPLGMRIGKVYPTYVEFREYDVGHEDFLGPNYVAVHTSMTSLLRDLAN